MSKTLQAAVAAAHIAQVVHHGEKLILPEKMDIDDAIGLLVRRRDYLQESTTMQESFDVFPWDGANAIHEVLSARYGWAQGVPTPGFWGDTPPSLISIEVKPGVFKRVPWGSFAIPGVSGLLTTDMQRKGNRLQFVLAATVLRKDEATVASLFEDVRSYLKEHSIYLGQAVKIRFLSDAGKVLPTPEVQLIDTTKIDESLLIYSDDLQASIETNLFTPIERVRELAENGITVKRGVLLGGTYGTGKTLAASVAAKKAVQNGVTHLYVPRADELAHAIEFAKQYQSPACVVYCEDIDRAMAGERTVKMDDLLNIIDGIDTKSANILTILTTNDLDSINPAMLRPGRLDAVIEVTPPDAKAVERLLRAYGGDMIPKDADLARAGEALAGQIPAVIAEAIKRARLAQLRLNAPGQRITTLSEDAIVEAARTMRGQLELLDSKVNPKKNEKPVLEQALQGVVRDALNGTKEAVAQIQSDTQYIRNNV